MLATVKDWIRGPRGGTAKLITLTVLVPLAFLALGVWESGRSVADREELAGRQEGLASGIAAAEAQVDAGQPAMSLRFRRHGVTYAGPLALAMARESLGDLKTAATVAAVRSWLPPVVMVCAGVVAALSVLALLSAVPLGRAARGSRDRLVRGFGVVQRVMPPLMGVQVLASAAGLVACVVFEALAIPEAGDYSNGAIKLMLVAAMVIGASLWTAGRAVWELRRTLAAFVPEPMPIMGRMVAAGEAPGLWRMIEGLAGRLGALRPDHVVVGLTGGFFVSSGPKVLMPGEVALSGRTLYLPLPFLPLLREDEVAAIIGHELGHFSGGDTEWSLRFVPIYAGVERSLDAVSESGGLLTQPTLRLGVFMMEQFHRAVRHWSQLREFAADEAGAGVTSADASARALLRSGAAGPRVNEVLEGAMEAPDAAAPDLVGAVLEHARARGLDDPAVHLEEEQPHPTDTHPSTRQRLVALGRPPTPSLLAEAAAAPDAAAGAHMGALFVDPAGLCRLVTADFVGEARVERRAYLDALQTAVAAVEGEQALWENPRGATVLLVIAGVFAAVGAGLMALGMPRLGPWEAQLVGGVALLLAAILGLIGVLQRRRGREPFMVLRPDTVTVTGLEGPIAWGDVLAMDVRHGRGGLTTRMLLPPDGALPSRRAGAAWRVRVDRKRRIVSVTAGLPAGMKAKGYIELVERYRQAAEARRLLAQASQHQPEAGSGGGPSPNPLPTGERLLGA